MGRDGIGDDWGESNRAMVLVIERPERKNTKTNHWYYCIFRAIAIVVLVFAYNSTGTIVQWLILKRALTSRDNDKNSTSLDNENGIRSR